MADANLPHGWIKQIHHESGHPYYVDTKAVPPRSIWVHPYQDEQYLREHPQAHPNVGGVPSSAPPPKYSKRAFLEKIKEKTIGTKQTREEKRRLHEQYAQQGMASQATYMQPYNHNQYGFNQPQRAGMGAMGRRGGGAGGFALPLLGGMAGGLLLGEALDGDAGFNGPDGGYGDGGDFGGGDSGGDFGGDF